MTAIILYTKGTREVRELERLMEELARTRVAAEMVDADSPRGIGIATSYDILARPAVLLTRLDGQLVQMWTERLPSASEIAYHAGQ